MSSMLQEIATYLASPGGITATIKCGRQPEDMTEGIVLYQSAGRPSNVPWTTDEPNLQVVVRSASYETADALLVSVEAVLRGLVNTTLSSTRYISIFNQGSRFSLGWESVGNNRYVRIGQNYQITRSA
jgi:hypothetical protein